MSGKGVAKGTPGAAGKQQACKKRSLNAGAASAAVIDDLFAAIPKRAACEAPAEPEEAPGKPKARGAAAAGRAGAGADGERRSEARRRRQEEYFLDSGEKIVPVRCAAHARQRAAAQGLTASCIAAHVQRAAPHAGRLTGVQVVRRL